MDETYIISLTLWYGTFDMEQNVILCWINGFWTVPANGKIILGF